MAGAPGVAGAPGAPGALAPIPGVQDTFELPDQYYQVILIDLTKAHTNVRIDLLPPCRNLAVLASDDAFSLFLNDASGNAIPVRAAMIFAINNFSNPNDNTGIQRLFVTNTASAVAGAQAILLVTGRAPA